MKFSVLLSGIALLLAGLSRPLYQPGKETVLIVGGDFLGYLSPCGCTKPMAGGVRRWATAVKTLRAQGECVVVVNGGLVAGTEKQDELKAESLAETMRFAGASAINLTINEAKLGRGLISSIHRLSGNALTSSSIEPSETLDCKQESVAGPFLIGAVDPGAPLVAANLGERPVETESAISRLIQSAESQSLKPVLLLFADEDAARNVAKAHPELIAIVYRSSAAPRGTPMVEGTTTLLTPGEHNKEIVSAAWDGEKFSRYQVVSLGPEIENDADVSRAYDRYLDRVTEDKLLEAMPRAETRAFAGSRSCTPCHEKATKVWLTSEHAHALKTLEDDKHGRDPDCVSCHVVGLESTTGYMNRAETPDLANVGCESCHGPAKTHAMAPRENPLGKAGETACLKCHTKDHSPRFDFSTFWPKIKH